jgi:capsular polysaccharide transport system ATP-binding protein
MSVAFHNVYKTLKQKKKKTKVFEGVDVSFSPDRITGILAPAGSGKSTAADLTTGKLRPDFGRVKRSSLVSFPVGGGGVFNNLLTGRENLAFLCRVFGFDPRPIIQFVIEFADLGKTIDKPFKLFSRDERTKFIFASSYAIPFEIYVVDESLIGGRGAFRDQCTALVRQRMETAGFVIYTSSPTVIRKYCNDFYVIDRFTMQQVGTADEAIALVGEAQLRDGDGSSDEATGGEVQTVDPG